MDQTQFSTKLRAEVERFRDGFRESSAAFLVWYLVNFFRISEQDAKDAVCDKVGDKGIDGVWIDETENDEEIYLFQSKFSPLDNRDQGDNDLRNFVGATSWFETPETIDGLLKGVASSELKSLISGLKIKEKISKGCKVNLLFITNKVFDTNAKEFLKANVDKLEADDFQRIFDKYTYVAEEEAVAAETVLDLKIPQLIEYSLVKNIKVSILVLQAKELLKLDGIKDNTLFAKNVRYGLGKTRVNKDIRDTLKKKDEHPKFFLYHNGITIVCQKIETLPNSVKISGYSVINGCQSVLTFYENSSYLGDEIYVLTKMIEVPSASQISVDDITYWENNQNAISVRDLKANDLIQRCLQREFEEVFENKVLYRRQRGDPKEGYFEIIERDFAAQLIAAFYLGEPHITHLRNSLFEDRYFDVFSKHINASKIYLANVIYKIIDDNAIKLQFERIRNYGLAKFFILNVVGALMREDAKGQEILQNPEDYVKGTNLDILKKTIGKFVQLLILDIDFFIEDWSKEHGNFFDYKNFFKNHDQVDTMLQSVRTAYKKQLVHHGEDAFSKIFESYGAPEKSK